MTQEKKISWWLTLLLVSAGGLGCDCHPGSPTWDGDSVVGESFSYSVSAAGRCGFRLEGVNGSITVTGEESAQSITVAGERRVGSTDQADAEAHLQEIEVQIDDRGCEVLVKTVQPRESRGVNYIVDYTITVPSDLEVVVHNLNGGVHVEGVYGSLFVALVNGEIDGRVRLLTDGMIDLATVNGPVDLSIPVDTSARFSASVVNGTINTSGLAFHDSTSTRNSFQGRLGSGRGHIELGAVNGNIRVKGY